MLGWGPCPWAGFAASSRLCEEEEEGGRTAGSSRGAAMGSPEHGVQVSQEKGVQCFLSCITAAPCLGLTESLRF